jgi:hypothetical protein
MNTRWIAGAKAGLWGIAMLCASAGLAHGQHTHHPAMPDSALNARGALYMGVDQYTSTHVFEDLKDGGRIELQRNVPDSAGAAVIRSHLAGIARAFSAGDFGVPGLVHMKEVPGTKVMASKARSITWTFTPLPRGGEVRIRTADREALAAIHEFLAFQRAEHHAASLE